MNAQTIEQYSLIEYEIPKFGDVVFKTKDWREVHPFKVVEVVKDKAKICVIQSRKEKCYIHYVFALNENDGFRKFTLLNDGIIRSIKVRKDSKKEQYLQELIVNKLIINK